LNSEHFNKMRPNASANEEYSSGPSAFNHLNSILEGMSILQNQMVALTASNKALQLIIECRLVEMENRIKEGQSEDMKILMAKISEIAPLDDTKISSRKRSPHDLAASAVNSGWSRNALVSDTATTRNSMDRLGREPSIAGSKHTRGTMRHNSFTDAAGPADPVPRAPLLPPPRLPRSEAAAEADPPRRDLLLTGSPEPAGQDAAAVDHEFRGVMLPDTDSGGMLPDDGCEFSSQRAPPRPPAPAADALVLSASPAARRSLASAWGEAAAAGERLTAAASPVGGEGGRAVSPAAARRRSSVAAATGGRGRVRSVEDTYHSLFDQARRAVRF
jgi:hypothetical protein